MKYSKSLARLSLRGLLLLQFLPVALLEAKTPSKRDLETYQKERGYRREIEIWGREAMVSSAQPLASVAGARILAAGGNAIDAAVAVGAALNVTLLGANQIGGDTVMLIYWAETGEFVALDAYSKVPSDPTLSDKLEGAAGRPRRPRRLPGRAAGNPSTSRRRCPGVDDSRDRSRLDPSHGALRHKDAGRGLCARHRVCREGLSPERSHGGLSGKKSPRLEKVSFYCPGLLPGREILEGG